MKIIRYISGLHFNKRQLISKNEKTQENNKNSMINQSLNTSMQVYWLYQANNKIDKLKILHLNLA